jgi:hypothetical protein
MNERAQDAALGNPFKVRIVGDDDRGIVTQFERHFFDTCSRKDLFSNRRAAREANFRDARVGHDSVTHGFAFALE